tara:strand:- start:4 stop:231 length:228 start_codon:yes stop_codon:yes gene_type:complete
MGSLSPNQCDLLFIYVFMMKPRTNAAGFKSPEELVVPSPGYPDATLSVAVTLLENWCSVEPCVIPDCSFTDRDPP